MDLKGSRTHANLMSAFMAEAQASIKYAIFQEQSITDGYQAISHVFKETSENEKAHAKQWFKFLHDGIQMTNVNLMDAAKGEHFEWSELYKTYGDVAREEGFEDIAKMFHLVGDVEKSHEDRYNKLVKDMQNKQVFKKDSPVTWHCRYCGHLHSGTDAPEMCPLCKHKQAYFEIYNING